MLDSMTAARQMGVCVVCGNALESGADSQICLTCKTTSDIKLLKKQMEETSTKIEELLTEVGEMKKRLEGGVKGGAKKEEKKKTTVSKEHGSKKDSD